MPHLKSQVTKAVILAAGLGTRTLPITKTVPKAMLPVYNKPVAHLIVEDLVQGGIQEIIWVISSNCKALEDYFNKNFELETRLEQQGKLKILKQVQAISQLAEMVFIYQKEPRGTG